MPVARSGAPSRWMWQYQYFRDLLRISIFDVAHERNVTIILAEPRDTCSEQLPRFPSTLTSGSELLTNYSELAPRLRPRAKLR